MELTKGMGQSSTKYFTVCSSCGQGNHISSNVLIDEKENLFTDRELQALQSHFISSIALCAKSTYVTRAVSGTGILRRLLKCMLGRIKAPQHSQCHVRSAKLRGPLIILALRAISMFATGAGPIKEEVDVTVIREDLWFSISPPLPGVASIRLCSLGMEPKLGNAALPCRRDLTLLHIADVV